MISALTAASHIREGRLIPLLLEHVAAPFSLFIYYTSHTAQPAHINAFIDIVTAWGPRECCKPAARTSFERWKAFN